MKLAIHIYFTRHGHQKVMLCLWFTIMTYIIDQVLKHGRATEYQKLQCLESLVMEYLIGCTKVSRFIKCSIRIFNESGTLHHILLWVMKDDKIA